jgi:hypothetical protein
LTLQESELVLVDGNGDAIGFNDDWKQTQRGEIEQTGIPPADDREASIIASLARGNYTARCCAAKMARPAWPSSKRTICRNNVRFFCAKTEDLDCR